MKEFLILHHDLTKTYEALDAKSAVEKHRKWMKQEGLEKASIKIYELNVEATLELGQINARKIP